MHWQKLRPLHNTYETPICSTGFAVLAKFHEPPAESDFPERPNPNSCATSTGKIVRNYVVKSHKDVWPRLSWNISCTTGPELGPATSDQRFWEREASIPFISARHTILFQLLLFTMMFIHPTSVLNSVYFFYATPVFLYILLMFYGVLKYIALIRRRSASFWEATGQYLGGNPRPFAGCSETLPTA